MCTLSRGSSCLLVPFQFHPGQAFRETWIISLTYKVGRKHKPKLKVLNVSLDTYADITDATSMFSYSLWITAIYQTCCAQPIHAAFCTVDGNPTDHPVVDHVTRVHSHSTVTWCISWDAPHLKCRSDLTHLLKMPHSTNDYLTFFSNKFRLI